MTSANFSGKFILVRISIFSTLRTIALTSPRPQNKELSEKHDEVHAPLGDSPAASAVRAALGGEQPRVSIAHTTSGGVEVLDVTREIGGRTVTEHRALDGSEGAHEVSVLGRTLLMLARRAAPAELGPAWLQQTGGWLPESFVDSKVVYTRARSDPAAGDAAWQIEQVWGFEEVGGAKRHVRRVHFVSPKGKEVEARLVYDYGARSPFFPVTSLFC